jgi:hypothetical protein
MAIYLNEDSGRERIYEGRPARKSMLREEECNAIINYMKSCSVQPATFVGMAIYKLPNGEKIICRDGVPVSVTRASPKLFKIMREFNPRW